MCCISCMTTIVPCPANMLFLPIYHLSPDFRSEFIRCMALVRSSTERISFFFGCMDISVWISHMSQDGGHYPQSSKVVTIVEYRLLLYFSWNQGVWDRWQGGSLISAYLQWLCTHKDTKIQTNHPNARIFYSDQISSYWIVSTVKYTICWRLLSIKASNALFLGSNIGQWR